MKFIKVFFLVILLTSCGVQDEFEVCNDNEACLQEKSIETLNAKGCGIIKDEVNQQICYMQVTAKGIQDKTLSADVCEKYSDKNSRNECFAYLTEMTLNPKYCLEIIDKEQLSFCLGDIKKMMGGFYKIDDQSICKRLEIEGLHDWADNCYQSWVVQKSVKSVDICKSVNDPLVYYNCVRTVSINSDNPKVCEELQNRMPFPRNFPRDIFSVEGCAYWVKQGGSYQGIRD